MPELTPAPHRTAGARRAVLTASSLLFIAGTIGSNIGPALVDDHPVLVLLLSSRNRNLFTAVPYIDPLPYAVIGFLRVFIAGFALFELGRLYGDRAIGWTERQVGEMPAIYKWFERAIDRFGLFVVFFFAGSNLVWLMAGNRRLKTSTYLAALAAGIAFRLAWLWVGGKIFEDQIRSFLNWIEKYQWWVVIALFAISFIQSGRRAKRDAPEIIHEIEHPTEQPPTDLP